MAHLPDFKQFCEAACIKLWGEPDKRTRKELRWNGGDAYGARKFDLKKRRWYDAGQQRGGSTLELVDHEKQRPKRKLRGTEFFQVWREANEMGIVPEPPPEKKSASDDFPPIRATYPYHDEQGVLLFEVVRFDTTDVNERFRQRRPDGRGGWIWNVKGIRRVLYRLPELIAAVKAGGRVLVCEGEKDANSAVQLGYAATCNPGGVGKWSAAYDKFFAGGDVVVVSDHDQQLKDKKTGAPLFHPDGRPKLPGQDHAAEVAARLGAVAKRVRVIMFDDAKDLTEWVERGGTREQLDALIAQAPEQQPEQEQPPEGGEADADAEIERLAKLSALEYEQQRKAAAEKLGVRASILDKLVQGERARLGLDQAGGKQGHAISFPEPEPWPEPVDGAALLNDTATAFRKHIVMSDHARDISTLWTVHTYLIKRFKISPKLSIRSPIKRCGKTTLLEVLAELVFRAWTTGSISKASLFRVIEMYHPTFLIDEVDSFVGEDDELRGMLNHGHRYDGAVTRTVGDDHEPRKFSVYAAVALSGIGGLAETLADRSVTADLQRRRPSETITRLRIGRMEHLHELRRRIVRWVADHEERIAERDPEMPSIIDREADNWQVLLAIADEASGEWPAWARKAAVASHNAEEGAARLELLLADIRDAFAAKGTKVRDMFGSEKVEMPSAVLVKALIAREGRPWGEMVKSRKPLTQNGLARMLNQPGGLGIAPGNIGPENARVRGYKLDQFKEAFERYLPQEGAHNRPSAQPAAKSSTYDNFKVHSPDPGCAVEKCEKPNNDGLLGGCAVAEGDVGEEPWHRRYSDHYRGPPVEVPEQLPDPLDQHGAPVTAAPAGLGETRHHELAEWCRRWEADGEDPADLLDALRSTIREEADAGVDVEREVAAVLAIVRAGGGTTL